jgi:hypothetical protein
MSEVDFIDPSHKYATAALTSAERIALWILAAFSGVLSRTRDVIQVDIERDEGCVVLITAEAIEIRVPTVEWVRPYAPRASSRLWKRALTERLSEKRLKSLIQDAIQTRVAEFRNCCFCRRRFPLEHMTDDACHGCASEHRGIEY